jgi:hypothetical protein
MVGNGRLLAWTTAKVEISITMIIDMYASSLVIAIDLVFLLESMSMSLHKQQLPANVRRGHEIATIQKNSKGAVPGWVEVGCSLGHEL